MNRFYGRQGAKFVQEIRERLRLGQKDFADKLGVTRDAVSKWESGLTCPTREHMETICKMLHPQGRKKAIRERRRYANMRDELQAKWRKKL